MKPAGFCAVRFGSVVLCKPLEEADISQIWHLLLSFSLDLLGSGEMVHMSQLACKYVMCKGMCSGVDSLCLADVPAAGWTDVRL